MIKRLLHLLFSFFISHLILLAGTTGKISGDVKDTEKGLSLGVGLNYTIDNSVKVIFDYAYQDLCRLENVHCFAIGVKF